MATYTFAVRKARSLRPSGSGVCAECGAIGLSFTHVEIPPATRQTLLSQTIEESQSLQLGIVILDIAPLYFQRNLGLAKFSLSSMVNQKAQSAVEKSLDSVTSDNSTGVPGLVFVAVDKNGEHIAAHASGKRGSHTQEPMTMETVFWIASCTKLLATMSCMQAVEQGKLMLDDHKHLYQLCPELDKVKVLQEDGSLVDKKQEITLRMLLSHTAGFSYEFFNTKLRDFGRPIGFDVLHSDIKDIMRMPLVNQPGETWEYGINIDWAGIALERATGVKLNDWIQKNITQPLGLENVNMLPTPEMKKNLAYMNQRWPGQSDKSEPRDHVYREPILAESDEEKARIFHSGGAGLFARPAEYCQVLAALLNDGKSPKTGAQLLKPETIETMWENQISSMPDFARKSIPAAKAELSNAAPELYPQEGDPPQGWGLSFMITQEPGSTGRGRNTVWWAGIANLFWWIDRERGVAGMIASQILPFGDAQVMGQWGACENAVYSALS